MIQLLPCLAWLAASGALGGEFKSQRGFSFTYPDGWTLATKEPQPAAVAQPKAAAAKINDSYSALGKNVEKFDKWAVVLYNQGPTNVGETVTVMVRAGRQRMDDASCSELRNKSIEILGQVGIKLSNTDFRLVKVNGRDAISWHFDDTMDPPLLPPSRMWQVVLSSRKQTYIITCSARASVYDKVEPVFTQIVNSFRIEPDTGWAWADLSPVARSAILGGLMGGGVGGIIALARRARRKKPPAGPHDGSPQ